MHFYFTVWWFFSKEDRICCTKKESFICYSYFYGCTCWCLYYNFWHYCLCFLSVYRDNFLFMGFMNAISGELFPDYSCNSYLSKNESSICWI